MYMPFRTAVVLGAGVMGTQIAAHLANAGLQVDLLDIPATKGNRNQIVASAYQKALKQSPSILFTEKTAHRIRLGNLEDDFHRVADADWVIEAVIEKLDVKQQWMARLEESVRPDAVISTNTSGLPISAIAQGRSESFRQRFLGTHFFNPPRYLKLLELIPTAETDPQVLHRMQWFARLHLGKGVVVAKDTPSFIANRIGMYVTMLTLNQWLAQGYTIEEVDTITGTLTGRPRSATFRTADLVGLDTLVYVADHLYPALPQDESRDALRVPDVVRQLVQQGALGAKTGKGFYRKEKKEILSLNPHTMAYESARPLNLENLEQLSSIKDLGDSASATKVGRMRAVYRDGGRTGSFFRPLMLNVLGYCARRIPEIADSPADIDRAMRWGFGWDLGPFEIWDELGLETVLADMEAAEIEIPGWVAKLRYEGATGFYRADVGGDGAGNWQREVCRGEACFTSGSVISAAGPILLETPTDELHLDSIKADPLHTVWQNPEAALLHLGDGVMLYEFRSKGNTLSNNVIQGLSDVLDRLQQDESRGLVIGNSNENFSAGANLMEMGLMAQAGRLDAIADLLTRFQKLMQRIRYFPKPIVAAVQGRALGGGCELVMACPHVVAAAESYIGLVEVGVGLIPAGGGLLRLATWACDRAASESLVDVQPFLKQAFERVAMAKVSNSAYEAQSWGYIPHHARIVMNSDRRLFVAKEEVLRLSHEGYLPPPARKDILVLGRAAAAAFEQAAYIMQQGGFASDYDRYLANKVAYVLTGGDLSAPTLVSEDYLLRLERENFVPLLGQPKTQERVAHLLKTKKPLRN